MRPCLKSGLLCVKKLSSCALQNDHISRDEYMAICSKHEVDDVTAGVLGDYFHDLGIFLYFRDDIERKRRSQLRLGHRCGIQSARQRGGQKPERAIQPGATSGNLE